MTFFHFEYTLHILFLFLYYSPNCQISSTTGFPTGVANMGGRLKSKHGEAWGEFKIPWKNTSEGVHLIVKLPAISLQA